MVWPTGFQPLSSHPFGEKQAKPHYIAHAVDTHSSSFAFVCKCLFRVQSNGHANWQPKQKHKPTKQNQPNINHIGCVCGALPVSALCPINIPLSVALPKERVLHQVYQAVAGVVMCSTSNVIWRLVFSSIFLLFCSLSPLLSSNWHQKCDQCPMLFFDSVQYPSCSWAAIDWPMSRALHKTWMSEC